MFTTVSPRAQVRFGAAVAVAAAAGLAFMPTASAHVGITPSQTAAGSYTVLTVSVPHGCTVAPAAGTTPTASTPAASTPAAQNQATQNQTAKPAAKSPTTKVEIQMPEEILAVTPTRNPFWNVTKTKVDLPSPITDAHGNQVTQRDSVVTYTAKTALPDGERDTFELSVKLPEGEGKTVTFPTIQTCEQGKADWTQRPASGQSADDLDFPAPSFTLSAAAANGHASAASEGTSTASNAKDSSSTSSKAALTVGIIALVAAALGLILAALALRKSRHSA